jgi:prepilin signal peptidase PulO-like enzyme (type II secretory pathway)
MKKAIRRMIFIMVLSLATYFTYFSNNNGLSNIGIFILYLLATFTILAATDTKKKTNPNPLKIPQIIIVGLEILIGLIAIYFNDFITGSLFIITSFLSIHIIKNN